MPDTEHGLLRRAEQIGATAVLMGWQVPDLPDNSDAMASVARKFPGHYEVTFRHIKGYGNIPAYDRPHIRVIPPAETTGSEDPA